MFQQNIDSGAATLLSDYFRKKNYNFSVFAPAPGNHKLWFHKGGEECEEFNRFFSFHDSWSENLPVTEMFHEGLCQFLLIIPENEEKFSVLKNEIEIQSNQIRVIRSSSPVTKGYIWVEVFHHEVSKGHGVKHLCSLLSIRPEETAGVGNDYNDLDLLNFTAHSFIADNAPEAVKNWFKTVPSNEEDAFFHAVQPLLL
jgi:hydroxymethylpyrimidine pyrophosphatase-like HAD family hydrolase